jgi:hypothetical protein
VIEELSMPDILNILYGLASRVKGEISRSKDKCYFFEGSVQGCVDRKRGKDTMRLF